MSGKYSAWRELSGAFFCLEGEGPHLPWWEETLTALGAQGRRIPSGEKAAYHAACAMASNLVCALVGESVTLLARCGFSQEEALAALAPLMEANLRHLCAEGPVAALTGPVERGDGATLARHLAGPACRQGRPGHCTGLLRWPWWTWPEKSTLTGTISL